MTKLLYLLLLWPALALGAITERYVSSGSADTTWADSTSSSTPVTWATMVANAAAGDRVNVIGDATYSRTTTGDTMTNAGTATSPIIIRGYKTAIGDGYLGRTNGNGDLITTNMPVITYTSGSFNTGVFTIVESLNITSAKGGASLSFSTDGCVRSSKIVNSSTSGSAAVLSTSSRTVILNSDFALTGASGGNAAINLGSAANVRVIGCRIKGGPAIGVSTSTGTPILAFNTIFSSTGHQVLTTGTSAVVTALYNTIVGGSADGVNIVTGTTTLQFFAGNMFTDNGGYGLNMVSASNAGITAYNRYRDNTSGDKNLGTDWLSATSYSPVTSGGGTSDYVNAAGNDYNLISTSPAKAAGVPSYMDIGALQRQESTSTTGSLKIPSI